MDKHNNNPIEDLLADDSFVSWVLIPDEANHERWATWLMQNPKKHDQVERARNILLSLRLKQAMTPLTAEELAKLGDTVNSAINGRKSAAKIVRLSRSKWLRIAAMVLVFISIVFLFYQRNNLSKPDTETFINYVNSDLKPRLIKLSDQSLVILEPGSSISYPKVFKANERHVSLVGEAFFEVRKNPLKPFLVTTNSLVTKVLGTSFTVRAFPHSLAQVVVNTGKVQVTQKDSLDQVISVVTLLPNEEVTVGKGADLLQKKSLKIPTILSKEVALKAFSFNETSLPEIVQKLELAYHVSIVYDREKLSNATVTGSLGNLPLEEKIKLICKVVNAQYVIKDGTITIK